MAERGQATVELVAALPALLLAGLVALQLLAAGYAMTLADGAAEAGALALASGGSAAEGALTEFAARLPWPQGKRCRAGRRTRSRSQSKETESRCGCAHLRRSPLWRSG